jgi:endogenous inhibitor of DNA gyrase (YacG/DUF329 family)
MSDKAKHPPLLCPICKKPVDESVRGTPDSPYPFCSPRCKLIDLGRWLGGKYQIPVVEEDGSDTPDDTTH